MGWPAIWLPWLWARGPGQADLADSSGGARRMWVASEYLAGPVKKVASDFCRFAEMAWRTAALGSPPTIPRFLFENQREEHSWK